MGREVRKIKRGWEHPKYPNGSYIPLHDSYAKRVAEWDEECAKWCTGWRPDYCRRDATYPSTVEGYVAWDGERPVESEYMPDFGNEADMLVMYETCTEGTPISPAFETPEELARWLADNGASAFADMTATYEQWLATIRRGHALSMIARDGQLMSGVGGYEPRSDRKGLGGGLNIPGARTVLGGWARKS